MTRLRAQALGVAVVLMGLIGLASSRTALVCARGDAEPAPQGRLRAAFALSRPCAPQHHAAAAACSFLGGGRASRAACALARAHVGTGGVRRRQPRCALSMQLADEPQDSSEEERARLDEQRAKLESLFSGSSTPDSATESPATASPPPDGGSSAGPPRQGPENGAAAAEGSAAQASEPEAGLGPDEAQPRAAPGSPGDLAASGGSGASLDSGGARMGQVPDTMEQALAQSQAAIVSCVYIHT